MTEEEALKDAEINYSPNKRISSQVFTKKASEVLNVPIQRVEVRRTIFNGDGFGTLTVFVYAETDQEKLYYKTDNRTKRYKYLPTNIHAFENELNKRESMKNENV